MHSMNAECEGYGAVPADFMFVGISAGRLGALVTRVPLTKDASGRLFQRCLFRLGLSESDEFSTRPALVNCYTTNLVKARVLTKQGLNRLPTVREVLDWLSVFEEEVVLVRPKMIVALGDFVYRHVRQWYPRLTRRAPHPRWYASHGALAQGSPMFEQMVRDYGKVCDLDVNSRREKSGKTQVS